MSFILETFRQVWNLLVQSGVYLLAGFLLAGLLHVFLPTGKVSRWLGGSRWRSVLNAALIGTPLPLCSCAVVPMAAALRRRGASRGATTAFLISTPESGADSIAATYALMDPVMTIARPVAAFATAFVAGITQNVLDSHGNEPESETAASCTDNAKSCCSSACGCDEPTDEPNASFPTRIYRGLRYGVVDMFEELGTYLTVGFVIAGVLAVALHHFDPLRQVLHSEWAPLVMLAAGVPTYVCAASVTPMVAVLIAGGLSPGAGLVFLLAGPATNAASVVVLRRILGSQAVVAYLVTIGVCALAAGYAVDGLYALTGITPHALSRAEVAHAGVSWLDVGAALALIACTLVGIVRSWWPKSSHTDALVNEARTHEPAAQELG